MPGLARKSCRINLLNVFFWLPALVFHGLYGHRDCCVFNPGLSGHSLLRSVHWSARSCVLRFLVKKIELSEKT